MGRVSWGGCYLRLGSDLGLYVLHLPKEERQKGGLYNIKKKLRLHCVTKGCCYLQSLGTLFLILEMFT